MVVPRPRQFLHWLLVLLDHRSMKALAMVSLIGLVR
jgi:hypothetical protein